MPDPDFPLTEGNDIDFHIESIDFRLENEAALKEWILQVIAAEGGRLSFIHYVFCSDEFLHKINLEYLQHDTYTDIITFPYREDIIESDIFISIDRIKENAEQFGVTFQEELYRVIIHGVLHLLGFGDKTDEEKSIMRSKENQYVALILSTD